MQKSLALKILAIFFALYLPVVSSGVPLYKHYCKGNLEDTQWIFEAESCHEKAEEELDQSCCLTESSCHSNPVDEEEKDDCCHNEVELYKAEIPAVAPQISLEENLLIEFQSQPIILAFTKSDVFSYGQILLKPPDYSLYLNGQARVVIFQQFLC